MLRAMQKVSAAALAAFGLTGSHAQDSGGISGGVVKVAVLTDLSGPYSDIGGTGTVAAAQMAIDDFKAHYKPNFKIELVAADHQNKADIASTKAREWYDTQGVDVITEVQGSAVALAVAKIATEKGKLMLTTGAATTRLTNEDCSPGNVVQWVFDTYALAQAGKAVTQTGKDTWFMLTADYAGGHALEADTAEAIKAAGGRVLGSVRHPFNTPDFSSYVLQAQASKSKVVGLANAGSDTINSIKAANDFGLTKNQTIVGLLTSINDIHALGLRATQGMMFIEGFYWNFNKETREWSRRFFSTQKKMPSMLQAGNYSAVLHYLKAVQAAGTDSTAPVMAQMSKARVNDMFAKDGVVREDGRMVHDMYLVEVKKPSESQEAWDYYNVKRVIPGDKAFQPLAMSRCPLVKK